MASSATELELLRRTLELYTAFAERVGLAVGRWNDGGDNGWIAQGVEAKAARVEVLETALQRINAVRSDIVGRQTINWSAHIYPIVAALEEAGFEGDGYDVAREKSQTADERIAQLETDLAHVKCEARTAHADLEGSRELREMLVNHTEAMRTNVQQILRRNDIEESVREAIEEALR